MNGRRPASPPPGRCEHATQLPLLQTLPGHFLRGQIHSKGLHSSAPWLNVGCQDKVLGRGMMLMLETDWAEVEAADCHQDAGDEASLRPESTGSQCTAGQ